MENTGEPGQWVNAFHLGGVHLQPPDDNGLENTPTPRWSCVCCGTGGSCTFSPLAWGVQTASRGNHLTHFHPISTAECVHFQANGMSFCRSFWSRINPGIKTDFPESNLPSSIDFFTLAEPVLPNLTWQPAAQWTGSTLVSHRGSVPPPSLHEAKDRYRRGGEQAPRCKKNKNKNKTKQRAFLKENRNKASVSVLPLIMFSKMVFLGQVRLKAKRGDCSVAISYHYGPVDISLSLSDSHLWFPPAIFCRCT